MIAGTALAALAATSAYGLQKTRQAERVHTENMKVLDKPPQRAQRFPAVSPHVLLEDPNTYQRHFDVYKSSPTRTYIGGKGVYAITGFPK
jgi:hypothetical protein